jgi:hypothetical protein
MAIAITTAVVALFGLGAVAGFVLVVSLGIRREERNRTMTLRTEDKIARGARVANGVHARRPALIHEAVAYRHDLPASSDLDW